MHRKLAFPLGRRIEGEGKRSCCARKLKIVTNPAKNKKAGFPLPFFHRCMKTYFFSAAWETDGSIVTPTLTVANNAAKIAALNFFIASSPSKGLIVPDCPALTDS